MPVKRSRKGKIRASEEERSNKEREKNKKTEKRTEKEKPREEIFLLKRTGIIFISVLFVLLLAFLMYALLPHGSVNRSGNVQAGNGQTGETGKNSAGEIVGEKMLVIFDNYCTKCNDELNSVLNVLSSRIPEINTLEREYLSPNSASGAGILREIKKEKNSAFVPMILFTGVQDSNIQKALSRYLIPFSSYYILYPAWTVRLYDPDAEVVTAKFHADGVFRNIIPYLYARIPNLVLDNVSEGNAVLYIEIPEKYSENVRVLLSGVDHVERKGDGTSIFIVYPLNMTIRASEPLSRMLMGILQSTIPNARFSVEEPSDENAFVVVFPESVLDRMKSLFTGAMFSGNTLYYPKKKEINVELYVMSFCPYGNIAESVAKALKEKFGGRVNVLPRYIIYTDAGCNSLQSRELGGKTVCSLHGNRELNQDVREYCVYELYGGDVWLDYANWVDGNCNIGNISSCWSGYEGINASEVEECFNKEFNKIVFENVDFTDEKGVSGSPTTFIEGFLRYDIRSPDFGDVICSFLENPPSDCALNVNTSAEGGCG